MIKISKKAQESVKNGFSMHAKAHITLKDGTEIDISEDDIMEGGIKIDEATSSDSSFDIGSTIISKCTLSIFVEKGAIAETYKWNEAKIIPYVGIELDDGSVEWIKRGVYWSENPVKTGNIYTLECLDSLSKLDRQYRTTISFPTTCYEMVKDICKQCEVGFVQESFVNSDFIINNEPNSEKLTCRALIGHIAQIVSSYVKCDHDGNIALHWYDDYSVPKVENGGVFDTYDKHIYRTGNNLNGGNFIDYSTGDIFIDNYLSDSEDFHLIDDITSREISQDKTVITGIKCTISSTITGGDGNEETKEKTYRYGEEGYCIDVTGNGLIGEKNVVEVLELIGKRIVGLEYHRIALVISENPAIEAGDSAIVVDDDGLRYPMMITNFSHTIRSNISIQCNGENKIENNADRYSNNDQIKADVSNQAKSYYESAKKLISLLTQSMGFFHSEKKDSAGSITFYIHNNESLNDSQFIWRIDDKGIYHTTNGGLKWIEGLEDEFGNIRNLLSKAGLRWDWIRSGGIGVLGKTRENKNFGELVVIEPANGSADLGDGMEVPFSGECIKLKSGGLYIGGQNENPLIRGRGIKRTLTFSTSIQSMHYKKSGADMGLKGLIKLIVYAPDNFMIENCEVYFFAKTFYSGDSVQTNLVLKLDEDIVKKQDFSNNGLVIEDTFTKFETGILNKKFWPGYDYLFEISPKDFGSSLKEFNIYGQLTVIVYGYEMPWEED